MEFDYFYMFFRVYVEKMIRRQFLIGYQFGQEEILSVYGVFKLRFEGYVGVVEFYFYFKCFVQQRNVDIVFDVGVGGGYSIQGLVSYGGQRCLYGFRVI